MTTLPGVAVLFVALVAQAREPDFAGRALREWIGDLASADAEVRDRAVASLSQMGTDAASAVPALLEALRRAKPVPLRPWDFPASAEEDDPHEPPRVAGQLLFPDGFRWPEDPRADLAHALARVDPGSPVAVQDLRGLMKDPNFKVRRAAGAALGSLRWGGASALLPALEDADPFVREAAVYGLAVSRIRGDGLTEALAQRLGDRAPRVRKGVVLAMALLGPAAAPRLRQALRDGDWVVCTAAARSLSTMGDTGEAALVAAVASGSPPARRAAAFALGSLGTWKPEIVRALDEAQSSTEWYVRDAAAWALSRLRHRDEQGPGSAAHVPTRESLLPNLALEHERRGEWRKAAAAYEAWSPTSRCGSGWAALDHERAARIARCRFELGESRRPFETLTPYLEMHACLCDSGDHPALLGLYVELAARAGRLAEARERLETMPEWLKPDYRKALERR